MVAAIITPLIIIFRARLFDAAAAAAIAALFDAARVRRVTPLDAVCRRRQAAPCYGRC